MTYNGLVMKNCTWGRTINLKIICGKQWVSYVERKGKMCGSQQVLHITKIYRSIGQIWFERPSVPCPRAPVWLPLLQIKLAGQQALQWSVACRSLVKEHSLHDSCRKAEERQTRWRERGSWAVGWPTGWSGARKALQSCAELSLSGQAFMYH